MSPPGWAVSAVVTHIQRPVVSLLHQGGAVMEISGLAMVASTKDALVIEDGAGEDPGGGLQQVSGPGVAGARVGHQSPGLETLSHHESGHVSGTLGVSWPEILLRTIIVPLEGQPSIKGTLGDNETLEMLRVSSFILHKKMIAFIQYSSTGPIDRLKMTFGLTLRVLAMSLEINNDTVALVVIRITKTLNNLYSWQPPR